MKNLFLILGLSFITSLSYAKKTNLYNVLKTLPENDVIDCKVKGFNLIAFDGNFKKLLDDKLMTFGGLKVKDFDIDSCVYSSNLSEEGVVTANFMQKNNKFVGHHLDMFVAFDANQKKTLAVLIDEENKSYILGDKDQLLISALKKSYVANENFKNIDFTSPYTFKDLNAEFQSNKENEKLSKIIEKRIEENKKLYNEARVNIKKDNPKDLVFKDQSYVGYLKDGEKRDSKISIFIKMDPNINIPLSKKEVSQNLYFVSVLIKTGLKNPYSFKPRNALVEQQGALLKINLEYTAQNSYGADVVGYDQKVVFLGRDGKYHPNPEK